MNPLAILSFCALFTFFVSAEESVTELADFSFEDLLNVNVETAGKFEQSKDQSPAIISIITQSDIALYGGQTLFEVLDRLPGVQMMGSFFYPQNLAVIRGTQLTHSNNEVLLLLNGRPLRDSFTGGQNFAMYSAFPVSSIQQIEIIRGPGSVLYGSNAFLGVINVITHNHAKKSLDFSVGEEGNRNLEMNYGEETLDGYWNLSGKAQTDSGWRHSALDNSGEFGAFNAGKDNLSLLVSGKYREFSLSAAWMQTEQDFWGAVSSWAGAPEQSQRRVKSTRATLDLGYKLILNEQQYIDSNVSYSSSDFSHYNYDAASDNWLLETTWHHQDLFNGHLLAGATLWHQRVSSQSGFREAPIPDFSRNWQNAYLQFQTQDYQTLNGFIGIQYNKVPDVDGHWVYRGGVNWSLSPQRGLKLLWGEAFRAAYAVETHFDLVVCCDEQGNNRGGLRGNPSLAPEEIETLELQYYVNTEQSRWSISGFHSKLRHLIGRERAADRVIDFVNTGRLESHGIEFELKHFFSSDLQLDMSATWQQNSADDVDNYTLMPDWLFKVGAVKTFQQGASLSLFLNAQDDFYTNSIRYSNAQMLNPEADKRFELTLHYRYPVNWFDAEQSFLSLYVTNALNEALYQPDIAGGNINTHPAGAGRRVNIGLSVNF